MERFELGRTAGCVRAHQDEIMRVGHNHKLVAVQVAAHLVAFRHVPDVLLDSFHLDDASVWCLAGTREAPLHLVRSVESEVGMARALVGQLADTEHFRFEPPTHGIEQRRKCPVAQSFLGRAPRGPGPAQIREVGFSRGSWIRRHG